MPVLSYSSFTDTIHDIALSGLPVLSGDVFDEIFESRNPDIKKIAKVHTTYKTFYGGLNSVLDGKATLLVSEALLKYYIKERFTGRWVFLVIAL